MTTQKQSAANKANAQKSTGPVTPAGKAVTAGNAIKHGILASRILLAGEDGEMFQQLLSEMGKALRPVGILEQALAEKIAAAVWKQRRLIEAETVSIELSRDTRHRQVRKQIDMALGGYGDTSKVTDDDLADLTADDRQQIKWCSGVVAEFDDVQVRNYLAVHDLATLAEKAPLIYGQLKDEATEELEEGEAGAEEIATYAAEMESLIGWGYQLKDWCIKELAKLERRPMVQAVAKLVQTKLSAPVEMELLARYQVAIDAELYRAMDALRKQQEWRMKSGIEVQAEVVDETQH